MYDIAKRFSMEARKKAAEATYFTDVENSGAPRTQERFCPLGIMIRFDIGPGTWGVPIPSDVVQALTGKSKYSGDIYDEASIFIKDWDGGRISNLKEALGVEN